MIYGPTTLTGTFAAATADRLLLNRAATAMVREAPAKIVARLDSGGVAGEQVFKPVAYDALGNLVAQGPAITVLDNATDGWFELPFGRSGIIPAGTFYYGLATGPLTGAARVATTSTPGLACVSITEPYADGVASAVTIPAVTADSSYVQHLVTSSVEVQNVGILDVDELSALPWPESQRRLGLGGPLRGRTQRTTIGWHGTSFDPVLGAVGVVRKDGPLRDLAGERVRLTHRNTSVVVYIHDLGGTIEDLSITRRAFMALDMPSLDSLPVLLEVMG